MCSKTRRGKFEKLLDLTNGETWYLAIEQEKSEYDSDDDETGYELIVKMNGQVVDEDKEWKDKTITAASTAQEGAHFYLTINGSLYDCG